MTPTSTNRPPAETLLRRFARAEDGATAVEFAMIAVPFLMFLFAIIETGLIFFTGQLLDKATAEISRQIRTGQAHNSGLTGAKMVDAICSEMIDLTGCRDKLMIDVKTYDNFASVNLTSPIDAEGNIQQFSFEIGEPSDVVVVRAFYTWPPLFHLLPTAGALTADGNYLLGAVAAFQNEPFPW